MPTGYFPPPVLAISSNTLSEANFRLLTKLVLISIRGKFNTLPKTLYKTILFGRIGGIHPNLNEAKVGSVWILTPLPTACRKRLIIRYKPGTTQQGSLVCKCLPILLGRKPLEIEGRKQVFNNRCLPCLIIIMRVSLMLGLSPNCLVTLANLT